MGKDGNSKVRLGSLDDACDTKDEDASDMEVDASCILSIMIVVLGMTSLYFNSLIKMFALPLARSF